MRRTPLWKRSVSSVVIGRFSPGPKTKSASLSNGHVVPPPSTALVQAFMHALPTRWRARQGRRTGVSRSPVARWWWKVKASRARRFWWPDAFLVLAVGWDFENGVQQMRQVDVGDRVLRSMSWSWVRKVW